MKTVDDLNHPAATPAVGLRFDMEDSSEELTMEEVCVDVEATIQELNHLLQRALLFQHLLVHDELKPDDGYLSFRQVAMDGYDEARPIWCEVFDPTDNGDDGEDDV
jgi:hypothetical protein